MATAPTLITMEQYLHTSYSPDVDFIDGELQERNVGERDHARLQALLSAIFVAQESKLGVISGTEQRIRTSLGHVRICDFSLLREDAPYEPVLLTPPILCIEIMSPEDRLSRVIRVLEDYRSMGVDHIWLIDPQERLAYFFRSDGLHQQQDLLLHAPGTEIMLDVRLLFQDLDRQRK
jgi:Uma2 family endonuclease